MINEETKDSQEALLLFREVNYMSLLNHPSVLKFIGYYQTDFEGEPRPTIITELATNGSLRDIIEMELSGLSPTGWDDTKKLINIYGIASGLLYLHSHNLIHLDLKPENVLIDDFLYPKISDFGLSKITDFISISMNIQSQKGLKGTPIYLAPEIYSDEQYSKATDVYAFAFIVYEIITGQIPFEKFTIMQIMKKVINGYRPEIKEHVPDAYRELIESCWSQDPEKRPTFEQIVEDLKNNEGFITDLTDQIEFDDYVDFVDNYESTFDLSKRTIHFSDFIKIHGQSQKVRTFSIKNGDIKEIKLNKSTSNIKISKNIENEKKDSYSLLYPEVEFNKLNKKCQKIVIESSNSAEKQFLVGQYLIKGTNDFPKSIDLGLQYIENCNKQKYIESMVYYIQILIKGEIVPQNLNRANELLFEISKMNDPRYYILKGKISKKNGKFTDAANSYKEGAVEGNAECMYKYGQMLFIGEGTKKNVKEALKYFTKSNEKGYKKSQIFLIQFDKMKKVKGFSRLSEETQLFFIKNQLKMIIKSNDRNNQSDFEFDFIKLKPEITEKFFFNKSLKNANFSKCLNKYKNVSIELEFPSRSFKIIFDLLNKIRSKECPNIKIGIVISTLKTPMSELGFTQNISYFDINSSCTTIPSNTFKGCSSVTQIIIPSSVTAIEKNAFEGCSSLKEISIPSSVTSINEFVFMDCSSMTKVSIPSSVTVIKERAFYNCSSLKEINIPTSVTSIEANAFECCSSLKKIIIPSSIKSIEYGTFKECFSLEQITIPSTVLSIKPSAFESCSSLKQIAIPSSVRIIEAYTFFKCSSLIQVTLPSSIISIGTYAFSECKSLSEIQIPSSVTFIGPLAFEQCASLTQLSIPSSINSIGKKVFFYCLSLKQLIIPSSVTSIKESAFYGCRSLTQVTFPSSVKSIEKQAFAMCSSLTEMTINSKEVIIHPEAFKNSNKISEITMPSNLKKDFPINRPNIIYHLK